MLGVPADRQPATHNVLEHEHGQNEKINIKLLLLLTSIASDLAFIQSSVRARAEPLAPIMLSTIFLSFASTLVFMLSRFSFIVVFIFSKFSSVLFLNSFNVKNVALLRFSIASSTLG